MNLSRHLHRRAADLGSLVCWTGTASHVFRVPALVVAMLSLLSACDDGRGYPGNGGGPPAQLNSFVGTTGVFAAYADPNSGNFEYAQTGTYAGKRQVLHGSIDFLTGTGLGQPAGVEIYKANDGHIYALDLTAFGPPSPQQISTESAATVDDTCSFTGTAAIGANSDYAGVFFTADLQSTKILVISIACRVPMASAIRRMTSCTW